MINTILHYNKLYPEFYFIVQLVWLIPLSIYLHMKKIYKIGYIVLNISIDTILILFLMIINSLMKIIPDMVLFIFLFICMIVFWLRYVKDYITYCKLNN